MDELMSQIWNEYKPYNRANDDKWRSFVVSNIEAETLESEGNCVTIVNGDSGLYCA